MTAAVSFTVLQAVDGVALKRAVDAAYEGFVPSTINLVGILLLAVWAFVLAVLMWRFRSGRRPRDIQPESAPAGPARRSANPR